MSNRAAKEYAARVPGTTEEYLDGDAVAEIFDGKGEWAPTWAPIQFDEDGCLKNVFGAGTTAEGYFAPAGT
ncbi:hypothetical protein BCR39DRAFT_557978 [Naematelia encephala]|uniref:Uncharacterized protein n=1 Tax=Naematelia encephala TaxID=71784 RepID=A0A1Y2BCH2_9TREE|nr:hypothetical protein BCR39DRAFT_557978 [Naematelia encephala]